MKNSLSIKDITPGIKSAVSTVLMAQAYAQTMREQCNAIGRAILAECPLDPGELATKRDRTEKITDPALVYLCDNEAQLEDYWAELDKRERAAGLKPDTMKPEYCPASVAEHMQMDCEHVLIDCASDMLGYDGGGAVLRHRLLCAGMEKYRAFIDLLIKAVVNLPDFKNPLHA